MSKKHGKDKRRKKRPRVTGKRQTTSDAEQVFYARRAALEAHLVKVHAADAYAALLASELWLPNLSAQVKHCFATTTFASIHADRFQASRRISSYADFREFITEAHRLLPSFPTLEDYAPERDWGEVRAVTGAGIQPVFYGGSVERITDFIDAFRMKHAPDGAAIRDLDSALSMQSHLISSIERPEPEVVGGAALGSLHVPSEAFWSRFQQVLPELLQGARRQVVSDDFVVRAGALHVARNRSDFGDAIMRGTALPYVFLDIGGDRYPVAPRESASVVIQHWEQHSRPQHQVEATVSASLAPFIASRLRHAFTGPYRIAIRDGDPERFEVPAVLSDGARMFVIIALEPERLPQLHALETRLFSMFEQDDGVLALDIDANRLVQFRPQMSERFDVNQVKIIAVATDASPTPKVIRSPGSDAYKLFLPDFVSIFESVRDTGDLVSYFQFVDDVHRMAVGPFAGAVDLFAAFRQSHAMLVDGAVQPTHVFLDPHWGSNWRYEQLKEFWAAAPGSFPDDAPSAWRLQPSRASDGLICLTGRSAPKLAWLADLPSTSLAFTLELHPQNLDVNDGRLLELFIHCIADSAVQRRDLLPADLLRRRRVVTRCAANEDRLPTRIGRDAAPGDCPLFTRWSVTGDTGSSLFLDVEVDLTQVARGTENATDARFEAECLAAWLAGVGETLARPIPDECLGRIRDTGNRRPRFITSSMPREVDVPDHAEPLLPSPEHFKAARRDLAIVFRDVGATTGRYELSQAKAVIDPARDAYRALVHQEIATFARVPLALFAIEQFDTAIADYDRTAHRIKMSLDHDVDFDRQRDLAKAHDDFINNVRNYRYLLECSLSSPSPGSAIPESEAVVKLIARIDWLMVLYQASDTLHNEIAVGGIDLDSRFVPEVFYSQDRDEDYGLELADERLGIGASVHDKTSPMDEAEIEQLNEAMILDAGFSLRHLLNVLVVLTRWPSANGRKDELQFSYRARGCDIAAVVVDAFPDTTLQVAERAVEFLTLDPERIRVLSGRSAAEVDVPIWEHRKRDHRYAIRPLIRLDGELAWGAAAASRARDIWASTVADGYLPADLPWPRVEAVTASIKRRIEQELEERAFVICQRHAPHVQHGINFKHRYPKEAFEEVGDFDVLAYWPDRNFWLAIECKYNKPPFAIKDARRLREHIFGKSDAGGHIEKIVRRRAFLSGNAERLRTLLGWPEPEVSTASGIDLYVCPRIFYWMRNPPYPVDTEFVRIDMLDAWLQSKR